MISKKVILSSLGLLAVSAPAVADAIGLSKWGGNITGEIGEVTVSVVVAVQWIGVAIFMFSLAAMGFAKLQERQQEDWHIRAMIVGALMYLSVALFELLAETVTQEDESIRARLNNSNADEAF